MNPWLTEGDAWFRRNQKALETAAERDWALRLIERNGLQPQRVLEGGCANGWRLAELHKRYGCFGQGIDVSAAAIEAAPHHPDLIFYQEAIHEMGYFDFDLVICYFVLHWVDRDRLVASLSALDRAGKDGGYLLIGDFLPDTPTKVPYHHREGLWTWKADYAGIFLATGNYRLIDKIIFDHDTGEEGDMSIPVDRRAVVSLLRKEGCYQEAVRP